MIILFLMFQDHRSSRHAHGTRANHNHYDEPTLRGFTARELETKFSSPINQKMTVFGRPVKEVPAAIIKAYKSKVLPDLNPSNCVIDISKPITESDLRTRDVIASYITANYAPVEIVTSRTSNFDLLLEIKSRETTVGLQIDISARSGDENLEVIWFSQILAKETLPAEFIPTLVAIAISRFGADLHAWEVSLTSLQRYDVAEFIKAAEEYQAGVEVDYEKAFEELKKIE